MIITLKNDTFSAQIDSLGAQLISLRSEDGTEYIWQRDPAAWQNCSPLLFPTVGNCRDNRITIEGDWYELPRHGFCKTSDFSVEQTSDTQAAFILCDSDYTRTMYPYAFRLTLTYTLHADGISMDYRVDNQDARPIHFCIGAHPGFNCPLYEGERFEDYVLEFEQEESASVMIYDAAQKQFDPAMRKQLLNHSRILPLTYDLFVNDAVFFDQLNSRSVKIVNPATQKGVQVDYPGFETVAFWTPLPAKAPFVCVEPWNGSAIRADEDDTLEHRHFVQKLGVGESKEYHLGIRVL